MSVLCHICGPVKHEAPTVICAPCALRPLIVEDLWQSGLLPGLAVLMQKIRVLKASVDAIVNGAPRSGR